MQSRQEILRPLTNHQLKVFKENSIAIESPSRAEDIEIKQGQLRAFKSGDFNIDFGGLGPCLGLYFRDRASGISVAGHWPSPEDGDREEVVKFLSLIRQAFEAPSRGILIAAGCGTCDEWRTAEETRHLRRELLGLLREVNPNLKDSQCYWASGTFGVNVTINASAGQVVDVYREDEDR
jgi:hypothetical protein